MHAHSALSLASHCFSLLLHNMTTLKTGLGDRLISNEVQGKFTELPIIDLTRLSSANLEDRKALAAEVSRLGVCCRDSTDS